jgi:hypothetical protein
VRLDRVGPRRVDRREAQRYVLPFGPAADRSPRVQTRLYPERVAKTSAVIRGLMDVQRLMRLPAGPADDWVMSGAVPGVVREKYGLPENQALSVSREERQALEAVERALLNDLAYEHMGDKAEAAVWRFACECAFDKKTDFVPDFVAEHFKYPEERVCYIPVEYLKVSAEQEFDGVKFLPVSSVDVTPSPGFVTAPPVGSIAAVTVSGTDRQKMTDRARALANYSLRVLRIALREHHGIHDRQLRFRLGLAHSFGKDFTGWESPPDRAYEVELDDRLIALAREQEVATVGSSAANDIEKKAHIAMRWMERARFTADPLIALLFLFFALEALLGDKSEGLKAHALAFRQTMLGHVATGGFTDPNRTLFLYDDVRSGAVHGEDAPQVDDDTSDRLEWTVRDALAQYLKVARENGFTKRAQLRRFLNEHPDRAKLEDWLRTNAGPWWAEYFDRLSDDANQKSGND